MEDHYFQQHLDAKSFSLDSLRKTFNDVTEDMTPAQKLIYVSEMSFKAETLKKEIINQ